MPFEFEVFDKRSPSRTEEPWVTIQMRGNFSMNLTTARMITGADDPNGVEIELLYDQANKAIAFRRAEKSVNPYVLRKQTHGNIYIAPGKAFVERYGIDVSKARRYAARELVPGVVGFQLTDPHSFVERGAKGGKGEKEAEPEFT